MNSSEGKYFQGWCGQQYLVSFGNKTHNNTILHIAMEEAWEETMFYISQGF